MKRLRNEKLARLRSVGIGGIDEIHAELDRALENFERGFAVLRPTPDPVACDPHRAEPEPVHGQVAADFESVTHSFVGPK